jgi:SSS family solute:Na+ symporter
MTQLYIICGYLALLLCLGLFSSRLFKGTSSDYMLASHSIGPVLLLMSIFGTTMTAFALVGSTGESFKVGVGVYGKLASSSGIVHSLCFFLLGVKVWWLGKKFGYRTQIQFFRDRLESDKIGLLLFPILVGLIIPYLLIGVMASGVVINSITEGAFDSTFAAYDYGVPPWLASLVICGVVLVYVFFGGMRGTAWANTFQTIVFMILGVVTFFVVARKLGEPDAKTFGEALKVASQRVAEKNSSKLIRAVTEKDQTAFENAYQEWETKAESGFAASNGLSDLTIAQKNDARVLQDDRMLPEPRPDGWDIALIDHRALAAFKRVPGVDAKNSVKQFESKIGHPNKFIDPNDESLGKYWSLKKAAGVYRATKWAPTAPHGTDKWLFMTYILVPLSVGMFPHLFQHWLTAKSAGSFKLSVVCHPLFIMIVWVPCVLVGTWATSAIVPETGRALFAPHFPANAVLPAMVKALTTPVLAGLLSAGILAAIMSSLDSQFLCIGTMFTEDIAVHYKGKQNVTDRQQLIWARMFIVAIVIVTYLFSLSEPRRVFTLGVWCFSGFSSLFPLIVAALYWKRLTKLGAYACVLAAAGTWLYFFADSNFAANPAYVLEVGGAKLMPVTGMIAASTVAMVVVSLITPKPSNETIEKFFPSKPAS